MAKKEALVLEEKWSVIVVGVVCNIQGDDAAVTLHARVCRADAVRLVDIAWNRKLLWPHSQYRASCDFSLHEACPDEFEVMLWAEAVKR